MHLPQPFGLLNIDKPSGVSSRDVVNRVQRLFKKVKVGHAGTLDPLATGVLVVCLGPATRLVERLQAVTKEYRARFRFGFTSDTDDVTGTVTPVVDALPFSREQLEAALPDFLGEIEQVPPAYSAVHVRGKRAYDLARAGEDVSLDAKRVVVSRIELLTFAYPDVEMLIECGSGTYIRSIGRDLGYNLGSGAIMTELTRTRIGPFALDTAIKVDNVTKESIAQVMIPPTQAVADLPRFVCDDSQALALVQGKQVSCDDVNLKSGELALVTSAGDLYGLCEYDAARRIIRPATMFLRL